MTGKYFNCDIVLTARDGSTCVSTGDKAALSQTANTPLRGLMQSLRMDEIVLPPG